MNEIVPQAPSELLNGVLASMPKPSEPGWFAEGRKSALERLEQRGFPGARDEAFRFTPLQPILRRSFRPAQSPGAPATENGAVVMDNGFVAALPKAARSGVTLTRLSTALSEGPEGLAQRLGELADPADAFSALNRACLTDALFVRVARGAVITEPLRLEHRRSADQGPTLSSPRIVVVCESGSKLRWVETAAACAGPHLETSVTEIFLEPDAELEHVRFIEGAPAGHAVARLHVRQAQGSRYLSRVVTLGGGLSRLDLALTLAGPGAECVLDGAYMAGEGELVDHHTSVDHEAPHCSSNESYRGVLDGSGHAVFDGTVVVRRAAQRTSARQENRNLLLSNGAVVHSKPHLEIDADDVTCSHGATVGRLDPEQLHYLRTRAFGRDEARALLTYAFLREMVERISVAEARAPIARAIVARLPGGL